MRARLVYLSGREHVIENHRGGITVIAPYPNPEGGWIDRRFKLAEIEEPEGEQVVMVYREERT